jgi:para-nitrobenzyl esterase
MSGKGTVRWAARARAGALAAGVCALLTSGTAAGASAAPAPQGLGPVVVTSNGAVRGMTAGSTDEFLGIPYAAPPVGQLRWRPPQPGPSWHGIRDATAFAPHCAQPGTQFGVASTAEDCLYLNVFRPARARPGGVRGLPVMVWIHGGGLVTGESDDFGPAGLVSRGVIVVTINYRLGALGFLAHPALASYPGGPSGNYGLMDQQAALRWVRRDIGRFGGNPRDVTIFGESAGGLSVLSQLASPGARGLFARAIAESGAYNLDQPSLSTAESAGEAFATQAGCASQTAACLRSLPVTTILANESQGPGFPDVDGRVLTQTLRAAFASGQFNRVPVINGTNHDEQRLFAGQAELAGQPVTAANYVDSLASTFGISTGIAAVIAAQYPLSAYPSAPVAFSAAVTDAFYACPALTTDNLLSAYVPTFAYEFNDENAPEIFLPPVSFPYGAAHASELQYLFSLPGAPFPSPLSPQQQQLAAAMKQYWTSFAGRGVPFSPAGPAWPRFDATSQRMQSLIPPQPQTEAGFATGHHCAFWAPPS